MRRPRSRAGHRLRVQAGSGRGVHRRGGARRVRGGSAHVRKGWRLGCLRIDHRARSRGAVLKAVDDSDAFLARLAPDGGHLWSHSYGASRGQGAGRLRVDADGNVIVAVPELWGRRGAGWRRRGGRPGRQPRVHRLFQRYRRLRRRAADGEWSVWRRLCGERRRRWPAPLEPRVRGRGVGG